MKVIKILIPALLALSCYLMGYFRARNHFCDATKMVTDTLVVRDTHVIEKPVLVERTRKETLLVPVHDTTIVNDTIYVSLPMESRTYKGEEYLAVVSGYQPSLDLIEVYPKTMVVSKTETTTLKPSPWHYSLDIAVNYGCMGVGYIQPGIGLEIGHKKLAVIAEAGLNVEFIDMSVRNPNLYWQVGLKYNLLGR